MPSLISVDATVSIARRWGTTLPDERLSDRLVDIEVLLSTLGFAAVADPDSGAITAVAKRGADPEALWRLLTADPVAELSDGDLSSDDYLLIALGKLSAGS